MSNFSRYIEGYAHLGHIGVLIEFDVSDWFSKKPAFRSLAKEVAVHVAASAPASIDALLQQPFVKNPEQTVGELIAEIAKKFREELTVTRFIYWDTELPKPVEDDPPRSPANIYRLQRAG